MHKNNIIRGLLSFKYFVKLILIHIFGKWSVLHLINGTPAIFTKGCGTLFKEDAPDDDKKSHWPCCFTSV